jgi:hypothetical protein
MTNYGHTQWNSEFGGFTQDAIKLAEMIEATLTPLQFVGAGATQVNGTKALASLVGQWGNQGEEHREAVNKRYESLNQAAQRVGDDAADAKEYHAQI